MDTATLLSSGQGGRDLLVKHPIHPQHREHFRALGIPLAWRVRRLCADEEKYQQALREGRKTLPDAQPKFCK